MTSAAPDLSLMDLFSDPENLFKEGIIKDGMDIEEEWQPSSDDFFNSILLNNHFDLNDLGALPSSSSDSGLSSGLSCEQPLSPLLPIEEDQIELMSNDNLRSPRNFMDFDPIDSPIESVGSVDSPMRSMTSCSNLGSPATDVTEDSDFLAKSTLVSTVDPTLVEGLMDMSTPIIKEELPDKDLEQPIQQPVLKQGIPVNFKNITYNGKRNIRQLVRVTPVGSGNPRSILLPISLKDMKELRTIKIINAAQAKTLKGFKINSGNIISKAIPVNIEQEQTQSDSGSEKSGQSSDEISETESPYPRLKLNNEEKRLLQKEGITLPSHYPLTKHEERELKRIRRKIRNKISAQDSRKRKKEYVDGLEDRVKQCTEDNMTLLKRIKVLQSQNQSLAGQLKRVQALIQKGNKNAQPATCLMVLLMSLALVAGPHMCLNSGSANTNEISQKPEQPEKTPSLVGRSRSLLFTKQLIDEDLQHYSEELLQEEGLLDHDYSPVFQGPAHKRPRYDSEQPAKYFLSTDGTFSSQKLDFLDAKLSKKYIEPPLDDVWPPPKPGEMQIMKVVDKLEELTNELKINISDADGTRTVLVKVPQEI